MFARPDVAVPLQSTHISALSRVTVVAQTDRPLKQRRCNHASRVTGVAIGTQTGMDRQASGRSLILVTGEEGTGKTTTMRALLEQTPSAAKLDAEDVGQVNPFVFNPAFLQLLQGNVSAVITNFWDAGYRVVIAGSFLDGDTHASFRQFQARLPEDITIYLVHLQASKPVRDRRRIDREKPSDDSLRDQVDASYPREDNSLRDNADDYRYIPIDNSDQQLSQTIRAIKAAIPEIYLPPSSS